MIRAKNTPKRQPQVKLVSATPQGRTYAYLYRVGSQQVQVVFDGLGTDNYFVPGERTPVVSAAIVHAQRDHALLSL